MKKSKKGTLMLVLKNKNVNARSKVISSDKGKGKCN